MLAGTVKYRWAATLGGTACGPSIAGLCSPAALTRAPQNASITVEVQQVTPEFDASTAPEGPVPHGYPNCPMAPIPINVFKANAVLEMSLTFGSTSGFFSCCSLAPTLPSVAHLLSSPV